MATQSRNVFEFGAFRYDAEDHLLSRDGKIVPLTPKAADTLLALLSRAGHVLP
jgi:DNA-binding winged helix-turn-helix (wHTH) protein